MELPRPPPRHVCGYIIDERRKPFYLPLIRRRDLVDDVAALPLVNIARPDAARIGSWIRDRIAGGERQPEDFLILTRTKHQLEAFAHALEKNNVPYEISGARINIEEELRELILLLQALADPGNPVLTLAVLEGMFFGIDHDTLHEHALRGGHFHLLSRERKGTTVDDALNQLQRLWELTRTETADVAIPLIVDDLGILPYAAGGELGATRAGALLFAIDVLRQGSLVSRTTLADAIELLRTALDREDSRRRSGQVRRTLSG
jgi:ATP-dependent helicase/nuclease subunit A